LHFGGVGGLKALPLPAQLHGNALGMDLEKRAQHKIRR
jgi:hypothetical protein